MNTLTSGSNNIAIGSAASVPNLTGANSNNQLSIQNIIYGVNNSGNITNTISTGSIGIGTQGPFTYNLGTPPFQGGGVPASGTLKLDVNGIVRTVGIYATSDEKLKKDISPITKALDKVLALNGKTYNWRQDEFKDKNFPLGLQYGLIAQELEKIIPELIIKDANGFYAVNYLGLIPVLIESTKDQHSRIELQNLEIENLKLHITELKNKFNNFATGDVKIKINSIEVIPNPITSVSVVSYKLDNASTSSILVISDLQGKILKQFPLTKNQQQGQVQVSRRDLPNGMYVFTIVSGNVEVQSKKVLIAE